MRIAVTFSMLLAALAGCEGGQSLAKERAAAGLIDPDSAQFRNVIVSKADAMIYCGEVNGKNRFGGMVGFTRFVSDSSPAAMLLFEPKPRATDGPASARLLREESENFKATWNTHCRPPIY